MQFWLGISLLFLACASQASADMPACTDTLCWQVAPTVCLVDQTNSPCSMPIILRWQSNDPVSLCAVIEQAQQCWAEQQSGEWHWQQTLSEQTVVQLRDPQQQVLKQQIITVLSRQPKQRRRLATPWSVF